MGDGGAAHRAVVAVPVTAGTADRIHRHAPAAGTQPHGDHRPARVPSGALVAADSSQPDRAADQGHLSVPKERRHHRRSAPSAALTVARPCRQVWYTRPPRDQPMKIALVADGPLDAAATLARYHLWGEDPANRLDGDVFWRVARVDGRLVPYEVRWSGGVDDARLSVTVPNAVGA